MFHVLCNSFIIKWQETFSDDVMQVSQNIPKDRSPNCSKLLASKIKATPACPGSFHGSHFLPIKILQLSLGSLAGFPKNVG